VAKKYFNNELLINRRPSSDLININANRAALMSQKRSVLSLRVA